jgi:phosphopantetheinyl transferase (holo-ACP synthase)
VIVTFSLPEAISLAVCCPPAGVRLRGRELRAADRAAGERAWSLALQATGLQPESAAGSRAHTGGAGAALIGPTGTVLGVDLVSPSRVTTRHARAILDRDEWEALPVPLAMRGALGWGLKEAAAKALGNPVRHFPAGLTISCSANRVEVVSRDEPHARMVGHWQEIGSLLCVWVIKVPDPPQPRSQLSGYQ